MKEEAIFVGNEKGGGYLKHTLRGTFNLNLIIQAEHMDALHQSETVNSCLSEFNKFVNAAGKDEPTVAEIENFCKGIDDGEVRRMAELTLRESLKRLDKHRPQ